MKTYHSNPALRTSGRAFLLLLSLSAHVPGQSPTADTFNPGAAWRAYDNLPYVDSVAVQADGKVLVGGMFDTLGGQSRTNIGRVNRDGSLDLEFTAAADADGWLAEVFCMAVQPDGKIVVGGAFRTLNGQARTNLARLNADGTLDASFNPLAAADAEVKCIALQPDGRIIIGGFFYFLNGEVHPCIGRLNADGFVDENFQARAGGFYPYAPYVNSLALQPDGMILVGGFFFSLDDQPVQSLGRLNADGTLDRDFFQNVVGGWADGLAIQADGKILVSDWFGAINRLNTDGTSDASFYSQSASGPLNPIAIQANAKILVGGAYTTMSSLDQTNLARLNTDGTLDTGFDTGTESTDTSWVLSLALQSDGEVVAGGNFSLLGGQSRTNIGRLNATDPAIQSLTFDGSTVSWVRGGTSPEVWRTTFDYLNGASWTPLGSGVRVPNGWELSGLSLPTNATIRARGYVSTGGIGDSFVETVLHPALAIADAHLSGGEFAFNVLGPAGQVVVIEAASNLNTWAQLQIVSLGVGPFAFKDSQTGGSPNRFYRLRTVP